MEQEIFEKLQKMEQKVDTMFASIEKLRKYFLWTIIVTFATIILPLAVLAVAAPWMLGTLSNAYNIQ